MLLLMYIFIFLKYCIFLLDYTLPVLYYGFNSIVITYNIVIIFVGSMVEKTVPHVVNRGLGLRQLVSTYACPNDGEYIGQ